MKQTRKWLSAALALVMVLLLAPVVLPTAVEATEATSTGNVSIAVDNKTPKVGDTVTVTMSNKAMTVSAFICGLSFDKTQLECTEIGTIGSNVTKDKKLIDPELSTKDQANSTGEIGFGVVYVDATSLNDKTVAAGDFLTVKFKVKAAGEITVTAYESSAGADGVTDDKGTKDVDTVKLTATEASGISVTVNTYKSGATVTEPAGGWVAGSNTFTVSCSKACVVAVSHDGGTTYTRLTATASGPAYSFTAADVANGDIIAVILKGDINGDGNINMVDATRVKAVYLQKSSLSGIFFMAGDIDGNKNCNMVDATRVKAIYLQKSTPTW